MMLTIYLGWQDYTDKIFGEALYQIQHLRCQRTYYGCVRFVFAKIKLTAFQGKKRRLTFFECNNDLNSLSDVAKVCDLVLLLIDASFGFEMVCSLSVFC
jgi:hypothetical protein